MFVALPVPHGSADVAVHGARALGLRGLSVTMPHKEAVIPALDGLTSTAAALGAVNCIMRAPGDDHLLLGDSTDGAGFLRGLHADVGADVSGWSCVVLGAGGAGRAVVHALAAAGAASVTVANRDPGRAERSAALAGGAGRWIVLGDGGGDDDLVPAVDGGLRDVVADADLLVNATPIGMQRGDGAATASPVPAAWIRSDLLVADLVYHPASTPLIEAARARGAVATNGLSMLVHQAAVAFEHWTGGPAPVEVMAAAARDAVG